MLVSALMGLDVMQRVYAHAISEGYRFYSYGDASLLLPECFHSPPCSSDRYEADALIGATRFRCRVVCRKGVSPRASIRLATVRIRAPA